MKIKIILILLMIGMLGSIAYTFYLFNELNQAKAALQNSKAALSQKDQVHSKIIDSLQYLIKNPSEINQEEIEKFEEKSNNADFYIGLTSYIDEAVMKKYLDYLENKGYTIYYSKTSSAKSAGQSKIIYYGEASKVLAQKLASEFQGRLGKEFSLVPGRGKNIPQENRENYLIIHLYK